MNRSDIFLRQPTFQENSSQAKSQMQARLYAQTPCKMCGISGIVRLTAIPLVIVADKVCAEEDDGLGDALFFHTFGKKAFLYAISKTAMPTLLWVWFLLSSFALIWSLSSFDVYFCLRPFYRLNATKIWVRRWEFSFDSHCLIRIRIYDAAIQIV